MAEELWAKVNSRNSIMAIAESLIPYFISQKRDDQGNPARFASVQDVEFEQHVLGDINNIALKVKVLSDAGDWIHDLIIREFKDLNLLDDEIKRYNELERRCIHFENIYPSPMISIDRSRHQLVYEYNTGKKLNDLDIDKNLKDYMLGRIFGMVQGELAMQLNADQMRELLGLLLENLPFSAEEQDKISMLLEPHYYILPNCLGGYLPTTLFDPNSIEFTRIEQGRITKDHIDRNQAVYLTIPMQLPESDGVVDRMSDVASYYMLEAYAEFYETGKVIMTTQKIIKFFEGYNSIASTINLQSMRGLYPHGITLDLQMLLVFWIMKFSELQQKVGEWTMDDLRFSYFLLLKKPFLLF
ncbi:MAG: hypothetical protein INQ03_25545 [Candidatus Heimdallarchaeota archaeon]|nr:hypothetical protein [Candidatus Heimdallarchaeota archaeon]